MAAPRSPARYDKVGGTPAGILEAAVTRPGALVGEATEGRDLGYLLDLLVPLAGLPLLAPLAALVALPELAANLLSDTETQTSIHFHYTAGAVPALVVATIFGGAKVRQRAGTHAAAVPRALVAVALLASAAYGPNPLWSHVPLGDDLAARDHVVTAHDRVAAQALTLVPATAAVSATNTLGAHLSERARIFSFPLMREANWVAVDTTRLSYLDAVDGGERARVALRRLLGDGSWRIVFDAGGILILRRNE